MAHVKDNIVTSGLSGRLDKIVFRKVGDRTIVAKRPVMRDILTANQEAVRKRFKSAVIYARVKMLDPVAKAEYEVLAKQQGLGLLPCMVADYLTPPDIDTIDTATYSGRIGDLILVKSVNPFKPKTMQVTIIDGEGNELESGLAVFSPPEEAFKYITTAANAALPGTVVKALAKDRPGNTAEKEKVLA